VIGTVGTLRPSDAFVPHVHLCRSAVVVVVVVVVVVAVVDSGTQKRAAFSDDRRKENERGKKKFFICFVVFSFLPAAVFISLKTNKPVATLHAADVNAFAFVTLYLSIFLSIHLSCARDFVLNKETRRGEQ
jgi:Na+/H+ antiporter NhaC